MLKAAYVASLILALALREPLFAWVATIIAIIKVVLFERDQGGESR